MSNKLEFTKKLVTGSEDWTVEDAMGYWWQNPHGGWRLTYDGFRALKSYNLEHWKFDTPKLLASPGLLLALDRKLTAPYFLRVGKEPVLCFFDSKEATMYALYGDVKRFVAALQHF